MTDADLASPSAQLDPAARRPGPGTGRVGYSMMLRRSGPEADLDLRNLAGTAR